MSDALGHFTQGEFRRNARSHDRRHIFSPSTTPAFLNPAMLNADNARFAIPVKHSNAFGPVKTVRTQR
jgi:hypothetical protein